MCLWLWSVSSLLSYWPLMSVFGILWVSTRCMWSGQECLTEQLPAWLSPSRWAASCSMVFTEGVTLCKVQSSTDMWYTVSYASLWWPSSLFWQHIADVTEGTAQSLLSDDVMVRETGFGHRCCSRATFWPCLDLFRTVAPSSVLWTMLTITSCQSGTGRRRSNWLKSRYPQLWPPELYPIKNSAIIIWMMNY